MRKLLFFPAVLIFGLFSCSTRNVSVQQSLQAEEGVVINGVRWATRNVDIPGRFVENPENAGWFFAWNSRRGTSPGVGRRWERANDPCPRGWRVPTREEFQSLLDAGHNWTTLNGVYGRFFGTEPYQIFLPAVEQHRSSTGAIQQQRTNNTNTIATYWSSSESNFNAYRLLFRSVGAGVGSSERWNMLSVRCVAD